MLTIDGCRERQERFAKKLSRSNFDAALISHPRDIYYFTGLWVENKIFELPSLLLLSPGNPSWLATHVAEGPAAVDERESYPPGILSTMNPDNHRRLGRIVSSLGHKLRGKFSRVGFQTEGGNKHTLDAFVSACGAEAAPIDELVIDQQLRKDPDEIECIRLAQRANLAAYAVACQIIEPGISELEVLAECYRAAITTTGKPHFFNGDFRSGERGGPARDRRIEAGEIYIIDAWSEVDGYWSDLSRAWIVGGEPTKLQRSVYDHLAAVLHDVPRMVVAGSSARQFWKTLDARLREHPHLADRGLAHHGGHGVGLRAHEGPDINSDRDGLFEVGNTFTVEPGAYSAELRAGIRLENNFLLTETGVELLSDFPLDFLPRQTA